MQFSVVTWTIKDYHLALGTINLGFIFDVSIPLNTLPLFKLRVNNSVLELVDSSSACTVKEYIFVFFVLY